MFKNKKWQTLGLLLIVVLTSFSCRNVRIKNFEQWKEYFNDYPGITESGMEIYDNNKEIAMYYNRDRCSERLTPGGIFDIFSTLSALTSNVALNEKFEQVVYDSATGRMDTFTLVQAFKNGSQPYFEELLKNTDYKKLRYYIDTTKFGNMMINDTASDYFYNGNLLVTPDEMVGFMKRLYHNELDAFDAHSIDLVKNLMLQQKEKDFNLAYRYATTQYKGQRIHWLVGYAEYFKNLKNPETGNTDHIPHPYFFAMNFTTKDNSENWEEVSLKILKQVLDSRHLGK